jgi:CDP-diacylglycerol--serine O-phosphatidyltransferase
MNQADDTDDTRPRPRSRRQKVVAVIPSLLTLGNAACGFASITYAAKIGPEAVPPEEPVFFFAALLIFGGMVFDGLDGPIARLAKQTSDFGAQLDSLSDAITFGVAPAFLMLKFSHVYPPHLLSHPRLLWVIAVLYMLCVLLRLARFNVAKDGEASHEYFRGLPSPAAAGMVASLVIIAPNLGERTDPAMSEFSQQLGEILISASATCMPLVTLAVACLMVSTIRYPHAANQWLREGQSYQQLVKLIFAIVIVVAVHELAMPLLLFYFVFAPVTVAAWNRFVRRRPASRAAAASH